MVGQVNMVVRRLQANDAVLAQQTLARLKITDSRLLRELDVDYLRSFLQKPENVLVAATEDGLPVGLALAYILDRADRKSRMVLFYEVEVSAAYRRRGVGRAMVSVLKSLCVQQNVFKMWVHTNRSNEAALALYNCTGGTADASGDEISFRYDFGE